MQLPSHGFPNSGWCNVFQECSKWRKNALVEKECPAGGKDTVPCRWTNILMNHHQFFHLQGIFSIFSPFICFALIEEWNKRFCAPSPKKISSDSLWIKNFFIWASNDWLSLLHMTDSRCFNSTWKFWKTPKRLAEDRDRGPNWELKNC